MSKKKLPPGIIQRGNRWRIDTFYKGIRIRETCATPEMAETNLRKIQTLIDEGRYLEKKKVSRETLEEVSKRYLKWCEDVRQKDLRSKKQRIEVITAGAIEQIEPDLELCLADGFEIDLFPEVVQILAKGFIKGYLEAGGRIENIEKARSPRYVKSFALFTPPPHILAISNICAEVLKSRGRRKQINGHG